MPELKTFPDELPDELRIAVWRGSCDLFATTPPPPPQPIEPGMRVALTPQAFTHLRATTEWLLRATEDVDLAPLPLDAPNDQAALHCQIFRVAGLLLEATIEIPLLRRPARESRYARGDARSLDDAGTRALAERIADALKPLAPSLLDPQIAAFHQTLVGWRDAGVAFALVAAALERFKQQVVLRALQLMSGYRIMETSLEDLTAIDQGLTTLAHHVDAVLAVVHDPALALADWHDGRKSHSMRAVQGLLGLHRARILRALGGDKLLEAEALLARSLEHYEDRKVDETDRLVVNCYHASLVVLQQAYQLLLRGQLSKAASTLKTGSLLSRVIGNGERGRGNGVLESEYALIGLSIERARLRVTRDGDDTLAQSPLRTAT